MRTVIVLLSTLLISGLSYAVPSLQPVINGQSFQQFSTSIEQFGPPQKVIAGAEDECGGGVFPDDYQFKNFTIREDGVIREVELSGTNAVIFYGKRLDAKTTQKDFEVWFKNKIFKDEENPNEYDGQAAEDEYKSFRFYFKNGYLSKYRLWMDDC